MPEHTHHHFDPLLAAADAHGIVELCRKFGSYGMYSEEATSGDIGSGLPQRYDAAKNFIESGGRFGRQESLQTAAARTNYFRETYAYGDAVLAPGIEPFLNHEAFVETAREIHGRPVIVPAIVYANLLVPGQELAVHTDVPEFRGANRKRTPQWLLVAMHHSGLFDDWRMPIATAIAWFHDCQGGALAFYPDGPRAEPIALPARLNTAIMLDTDSVFHGVDRVSEASGEIAPLRPGMRLTPMAGERWDVLDDERSVASYRFRDMRFSVSWKAYCFRDEAERRAWSEHGDDLSLESILDRLTADLERRGRIEGTRPPDRELALLLIDEYIEFPPPRPA